jgi:hypothetical protein
MYIDKSPTSPNAFCIILQPRFCTGQLLPHVHNASNAVARLHVSECLVDLVERLAVRDELVHLEVASHVVGDEVRELGAALYTAESAAFPDAAGNELEGCLSVSGTSLFFSRGTDTYVVWKSPGQQPQHR